MNRDRECDPVDNNDVTSSDCSSVAQNPWDFTAYTVAFANSTSPSPSPTPTPTPTPTATPTPTPTPTPSPTPTSSGCTAAAWVNNTAYVSGDVVSYNGDQWTANQWNYDEVPGGSSGAWNSDGPC